MCRYILLARERTVDSCASDKPHTKPVSPTVAFMVCGEATGDSGVNERLHGALKAKRRSSFHKLNGPFKQWVHGKLLEMATLVLTDSRI